jgi:mRNA-degrading endonuclease toxin of MazEF toxin-antitoxin module
MSGASSPLRGQVFHVDEEGVSPYYWLVVSNNRRNAHLRSVLTVMLTTTAPRSPRSSCVPLDKGHDSFEGWVNCDDIVPHYRSQLGPAKGALSPATMRRVEAGLASALGLPAPAVPGRSG